MKIGILSRSLNIYSTHRLYEAAKQRGHEVYVIDHTKCSVLIEQGNPAVYFNGQRVENLDAVIPRIGASVTFFGTAVVRQFEVQGVFLANTSQSIVRSRDKLRSMQILSREGVGLPKTVFAKFPKDDDVDSLIKKVGGAPLIIKLLEGTQGLGVVLAETDKAAKSVIEAFSGLKENILVQEFIKEAGGADIRAFIVDGKVVGAMKRQGKEGEFRSNLHRGGKGVIIELSEEEERAAINAAKALSLSVAGVDMLQSSRGPLILEVNSSPGLKGIEGATGLDIAGKIIEYCEEHVLQGKKDQKIPDEK
jgi:ribosomal protein S6--L-glutamate ligase